MFYKICPYCGCSLDPSESCDCQQERRSGQEENEGRRQDGEIQRYRAGRNTLSATSARRESGRNG